MTSLEKAFANCHIDAKPNFSHIQKAEPRCTSDVTTFGRIVRFLSCEEFFTIGKCVERAWGSAGLEDEYFRDNSHAMCSILCKPLTYKTSVIVINYAKTIRELLFDAERGKKVPHYYSLLEFLKQATRLEGLGLRFVQFPNSQFSNLFTKLSKVNSVLQEVYLEYSNIDGSDLNELLQRFPSLRTLSIYYCIKINLVVVSFKNCRQLQTVHASGTHLADKAMKDLACLPNLERLDIEQCHYLTPRGFDQLALSRSLKIVEADYNDKLLAVLAKMSALESLDLSHHSTQLTDFGFSALRSSTSLRYICADGTKISRRGIHALAKIPTLKKVSIIACKYIAEGDFVVLATSPSLEMVIADFTNIGDSGVKAFAKSKTLKYFSIKKCKKITDNGYAALGESLSIEHLQMKPLTELSDKTVQAIMAMPNWRTIE